MTNVTWEVVHREFGALRDRFPAFCGCDTCRGDVLIYALNRLTPRCRETLRMYYAEGYSAKEIAERFGTTTGYAIQLLHVCRKRVRQAYDALKENKP